MGGGQLDPMKLDPIIAVKDVAASSEWYQQVFGCESLHGGDEFDVLANRKGEVLLCLHKWGEHTHPTLTAPSNDPSNGLILYFRTDELEEICKRVKSLGAAVEKEIEVNPNSRRREFSLRDPDGYYLTVSEDHDFRG